MLDELAAMQISRISTGLPNGRAADLIAQQNLKLRAADALLEQAAHRAETAWLGEQWQRKDGTLLASDFEFEELTEARSDVSELLALANELRGFDELPQA